MPSSDSNVSRIPLVLENVSRAMGLAEALARPIASPRPGADQEIAERIVALLNNARKELLRGL